MTHWRGSNCVLDLIETPYEAKGGFVLSLCLFQACVIVLPCYHLAAVGETIQYRHLTRFETSLVFLFLTFFSLFFVWQSMLRLKSLPPADVSHVTLRPS